jgi:uncharacterized protein (DUF697 family)
MNSRFRFFLLSALVAAVVSAGGIAAVQLLMGKAHYTKPPRAEVLAACQEHAKLANQQAAKRIAIRAEDFKEFVQSRKPGAKAFAEEMVSWKAKWLVVKGAVPFTDKEQHRKFVQARFGEHLFESKELESAVRRCVEAAIKDIEAIENDLAVALRQEVLGKSLPPGETVVASKEFIEMIQQMVKASQWDTTKAVASLVVSEIASVVTAEVLTQLGVSTGILVAGGATSWWTLGIGLAVGVAVDFAWEWFDDPAGKIQKEMIQALDELGNRGRSAIDSDLNEVLSDREQLWMGAIQQMLP